MAIYYTKVPFTISQTLELVSSPSTQVAYHAYPCFCLLRIRCSVSYVRCLNVRSLQELAVTSTGSFILMVLLHHSPSQELAIFILVSAHMSRIPIVFITRAQIREQSPSYDHITQARFLSVYSLIIYSYFPCESHNDHSVPNEVCSFQINVCFFDNPVTCGIQ